ncbi:MAG TPA: alpha/beta hydrolase [Nocardioides sp.]|nr:alpha/beta hydrolase [Nocardioides sp.]
MADLYRSAAGERTVREWCTARLARWDVPHETTTLETSLGPTHLTSAGAGVDACVYLPGTSFNAATSTTVLDALGQSSRVVCADLPGQPGLSAPDRPRDEVPAYGRWVAEVLAHVRATTASRRLLLVGHSRGAAVALGADPGSVDGLLLLSPAGLVGVRMAPAVVVRSVAWLVRPTPARTRRLVALMAGADDDAGLEHVTEWLTLTARSTRTTGAPGPLPGETLDRWRGHPVVVVAGERDVFFPPGRLSGPARRHLGREVETVPGAGHLLSDQRPDLVADRARALLGAG